MGKKYIVEIGDNENLYKTMITNGGKSYMAVARLRFIRTRRRGEADGTD